MELKYCGLDLIKGKPRDNLKAGVLEPMISKINSIRFATEAAITILRIDDMVKLAPEKQEDVPPHWSSWNTNIYHEYKNLFIRQHLQIISKIIRWCMTFRFLHFKELA